MKIIEETVKASVYYRVQPCDKCGKEVRQKLTEGEGRLLTTPKAELTAWFESVAQRHLLDRKILCDACIDEVQRTYEAEQEELRRVEHDRVVAKYEGIMGAVVVDLRSEDHELSEIVVERDGVRHSITPHMWGDDDSRLEVQEEK